MSEVIGLRAEHIQHNRGILEITVLRSKNWGNTPVKAVLNPNDKNCPTPRAVCDGIWKFVKTQKGQLFFAAESKDINRLISKQFPAAQGFYYSFHSFRHGRVSDLYAAMDSPHIERMRIIAEYGKWKSPGSVGFYLHF